MRPANVLSIGDVAQRLKVPTWQIRRAISRGYLDEPTRVGVSRVWREADLPQLAAALRLAGYLGEEVMALGTVEEAGNVE